MANLIITVISIALVAVAALSAAYYGGSAFMDGQKKAQTNQLITQAEQIAGAWTLQVAANGSDRGSQGTTFSNLVPTYLSALPALPANGVAYKYPEDNSFGGVPDRIVFAIHSEQGAKLCTTIAQMAGGPSATPTNFSVTSTPMFQIDGKFNCTFVSRDVDGNEDAAAAPDGINDDIYIIYRVF